MLFCLVDPYLQSVLFNNMLSSRIFYLEMCSGFLNSDVLFLDHIYQLLSFLVLYSDVAPLTPKKNFFGFSHVRTDCLVLILAHTLLPFTSEVILIFPIGLFAVLFVKFRLCVVLILCPALTRVECVYLL